MKIQFEQQALDEMHNWLQAHYPEEACGFLVGHESGNVRTITETWTSKNISTENRKRRFIVDPLDYLQAERNAAKRGLSLLGIYHSHPDHPAIPSEHDLAAAHPFFSYTIVSVQNGEIAATKSYQLKDGAFAEEEVSLETPITINE